MILVLSMPRIGILSNTDRILHKRKGLENQYSNAMVQCVVEEIILQETEIKKLNVEDETHENIHYEVDEDDLYELDRFSLN